MRWIQMKNLKKNIDNWKTESLKKSKLFDNTEQDGFDHSGMRCRHQIHSKLHTNTLPASNGQQYSAETTAKKPMCFH